jgi:prolyl oligopeptidase
MRLLLLSLVIGVCPCASAQTVAPVRTVTDIHHGVRVDDPYRYMESTNDPEVAAWLKSQSDYARVVLDGLPARGELLKRIEALDGAAAARVESVSWLRNDRIFYFKRAPHEAQSKLFVRDGLRGSERLLVDPEKISAGSGKNFALHFYSPSPSGRYVAYGISEGGSELVAMLVLDTVTGRVLGPPIDRTSANIIGPTTKWLPDESGFYFNQKQEMRPGMALTEKYLNSSVFLFRVAQPDAPPTPIFGNAATAGPRLQPDELPFLAVLPESEYVLAVSLFEIRNYISLYSVQRSHFQQERVPWRRIVDVEDKVREFAVYGDDLYVISGKNAPRFRVLKTSLAKPDLDNAMVVVPEGTAVVANIGAAADALYIRLLDGGSSRLLRLPHGTSRTQEIAMPFSGSIRMAYADVTRPGVLLQIAGWARARGYYLYEPAQTRLTRLDLQPTGPFDAPDQLVVQVVKVRSHDGVMVPLTIVHKRGVTLDGKNPAILTGYGAYGISLEPYFDPRWLAWLERGGVYAIAHVRGGGEYGEDWHHGGFQQTKPNSWKDLIACAEYLIVQRYTRSERLGLLGASAGGILVGRAMTERPDMFAAVVPNVGALDMVRMEITPTGPGNVDEFGSVKTKAGFAALLAMSTYHHLRDQVRYPAVLLVHGVNDPRVPVWASAKTAARLQATTTSGRPVLLRLDYQAGHGIGSSALQRRAEFADTLAFMLWQFGDLN